MKEENWRDIPGYEGWYQVSDAGRVKSLTRMVWRPGRFAAYVTVHGRIMNPHDRAGRPTITLLKEGTRRDEHVSRLVLEAFVGPCPEGMESCHFPDRDVWNNSLDNLRWGTKLENMHDKVIHGTTNRGRSVNVGSENGNAKLTDADIREIRRLCAQGVSRRDVASRFGLTKSTVDGIVWKKSWRHVA